MIRSAILLSLSLYCTSAIAKETLVKNVAEFDAAVMDAKPGDAIVLADGEWRDVDLVFRGEGRAELGSTVEPIVLRAETPGRVVMLGKSRLRIGGKHLLVRDLLWKDASADSEVIAFRTDSNTLAQSCVLSNCAIVGDDPGNERKWVSVYGSHNAVRNCRFEAKRSAGTLLVVWLAENQQSVHTSIEDNFFGPRDKLGKNGGEIIRIGDSKTSRQESWARVTGNYFYRCNGEAEIISNKSCFNLYVFNVFVGCGGALTLRHGNSCGVGGNAFFGDGQKGTGGVRIVGTSHDVYENLFHELAGDDTRAAVSIMNGIPDSPLNGYFQVQRALIHDNTLIDCKESIVVGLADDDQPNQTLPPMGCVFSRNAVISSKRPLFFLRDPSAQMRHEENAYVGRELGIEAKGWLRVTNSPDFDLARGEYPVVGKSGFQITKFELCAKPPAVGPEWMKPGNEYLPEVLKKK